MGGSGWLGGRGERGWTNIMMVWRRLAGEMGRGSARAKRRARKSVNYCNMPGVGCAYELMEISVE